jgi:NAD(P)-dependent dehydrogenase (short-subunit alcohol dehydrogenase family)
VTQSNPATGSGVLEALFSLRGKVALVTGGSKGIGRAIAEAYAQAGGEVVIAARNLAACQDVAREIAGRSGVRARGVAMDVTSVASVEAAVDAVVSEFGAIDVLVNCAGIAGTEKPVLEMADEDMAEVMGVVLYGTLHVARAVGRVMVRQRAGRIINVASILGTIAARNLAAYCASKAAVIQLTRVLALELMRDNVQVNVISPGYFTTDLNRTFLEHPAGKAFVTEKIPARRAGTVEELRSTALFLASCPSFLAGAEVRIDGGHSLV